MPRTETPTFHERDASLSVWLLDPKDERLPRVRNAIVRKLRALGWRMGLDEKVKRHYPSIARDHHEGCRGDLHVAVELSGRHLSVKFWQELVTVNRNGGRYDFHQRAKMPYLIGLQYEVTARKVAAVVEAMLPVKLKRDVRLRGQAYIDDRRRELAEFQGPKFYERTWEPYNTRSAEGVNMRDGQRVWFLGNGCGYGRWVAGTAWRNINNMWWVLLPCGTVFNVGSSQLHTTQPEDLRGRRHPEKVVRDRMERLKQQAVGADQFERAAVLRDLLARVPAPLREAA